MPAADSRLRRIKPYGRIIGTFLGSSQAPPLEALPTLKYSRDHFIPT